jgi:hypothetical protein
LRRGVEAARIELGQGFIEHQANSALRKALTEGSLSRQGYFEELLRLIYRMIFLFAAEDRELLFLPNADQASTTAYAQGYSISRLRERCMRRTAWDRNCDAWEGLKATFAALGKGEQCLSLPALGGLFADDQLPHLNECKLENNRLLAAIWRLAWMRPDGHPLTRVNWRDMETEELGSVYESLLELTPIASADTRTFTFAEGDETRGNARKVSGSYYTPDSLVQALLDESLNPLIEETVAGKDDQAGIEALLNLRIIDPACGSGHFLLAAARRLASRIARLSTPGTPSQADYRHWLREVARRSLFGVDRNPMAIQLAKVALWIETVEPGKPLSFLDAHLRCGDSLLGVYDLKSLEFGIPDYAYKPLTGDDATAASAWKKLNKQARERDEKTIEMAFAKVTDDLAGTAQKVETQGEDDLAGVDAKRKAFEELVEGASYRSVKTACDLYVAAFLLPKTKSPELTAGAKGITIPTTSAVRDKISGLLAVSNLEAIATVTAAAARAFHWPLEFPQVFFPRSGRKAGFDLALGNPPWERIKLQEKEYFASRDPDIANAPNASARRKLISALASAPEGSAKRALYDEFAMAKRLAEASSIFARVGGNERGRYPLTGTGDVNTYALFAELFSTCARNAAAVIPTGIATDATTAPFFAYLVQTERLRSLLSFREIRRWFTATDDRNSFSLFVLSERIKSASFAFSLDAIADLSNPNRRFTLAPSEIATINPNTKTAPIFRSKADAELTKQVYARVPVLIDNAKGRRGNPWGIEFARLFDMSNDSALFRTARQLTAESFARDGFDWVKPNGKSRYVPLYEAKMIHHYDHRWATYVDDAEKDTTRDPTDAEKSNPNFEATPRYWVPEQEVSDRLTSKGWTRGWLMGCRGICRVTDERSFIIGPWPRCGVGNSQHVWLGEGPTAPQYAALLAMSSSLAVDFVARQKVGGANLNFFYVEQFPMLPPDNFSASDLSFITPRVLELSYTSNSMTPFAQDLSFTGSPFAWNEDRRALLRAELDAKIAKLYGLTRDQLRYILDPADACGADYPSETFRVLKNNEIAKYDEYRTAKLVLQAFDQITAGTLATDVVRLDSDRIDVRAPKAQLPELAAEAWKRERSDLRGETGAMLVALLKAAGGPLPNRQLRLAGILGLEPRLLHSYLDAAQSKEWTRLIGEDAKELPAGTAQFVPPTDQHWGAVVRSLRTSGALVEDLSAGTWGPGSSLSKIETDGWPDGRARFVLDVVLAADQNTIFEQLPEEIRGWLDAEAA